MKLPFFALVAGVLILVSCTRRYECACRYKQLSYEYEVDDTIEVVTDTVYRSYISYTSKKLATEECNERGRALMFDSLKIESTCSTVKYQTE